MIITVIFELKNTVFIKMAKKYQASDVSQNCKEIKQFTNKIALINVKKLYLALKKIYNVNALLKSNNFSHYIVKNIIK